MFTAKNTSPAVRFVYDRKKQATAKKAGAIEIEVYYQRNRIRIATGYGVLPSQWNGANVVNHLDAIKMNMALVDKMKKVECKIHEFLSRGEFSTAMLKGFTFKAEKRREKAEKVKKERNFLEWLEQRIECHPVADSTKRQHRVMFECLKSFGGIVNFSDLTVINIKEWDMYLHGMYNKKKSKNCQNTIHGYHKRLKPYVREAVEMGLLAKSPYDIVRIKRGQTERVKYLTDEERDRIERLTLPEGVSTWVRDMFIVACYTGLAYSDLVKIKETDIIREGQSLFIEDKRQKTKSAYKIMLLPKVVAILKKYDYNMHLVSNEKCNSHLKIIAGRVGIDKNLTMHMGRHTFATWAIRKGVRIEAVSKMLAHADIKTTQVYAKVLQLRFHRQPGKKVRGRGMKKRWLSQ